MASSPALLPDTPSLPGQARPEIGASKEYPLQNVKAGLKEALLKLFTICNNNNLSSESKRQSLNSREPLIESSHAIHVEAPFSNAIASISLLLLEKVPEADEAGEG